MAKPTAVSIFTIDNDHTKAQRGEKIADALNSLFTWAQTHPGPKYWSKVHVELQRLERGHP